MMNCIIFLSLSVAILSGVVDAYTPDHYPDKYVIVTSPQLSKVSYAKTNLAGALSPIKALIEGASLLDQPRGVCVDNARSRLYVCDAGPASRKIYYYDLAAVGGELEVTSDPRVAVQDVESRWCSVDLVGNLYFSEESTSRILKVESKYLEGDVDLSNAPVVTVYENTGGSVSAGSTPEVSSPGGVGVDNFSVYWTNKAFGLSQGSIVKASQNPELLPDLLAPADGNSAASTSETSSAAAAATSFVNVRKLGRNSAKIYGLCLTDNEIFFTDTASNLYGTRKSGGPITTISDLMTQPRGCAYDGDGTVYVGDKGQSAIYSFGANMGVMQPTNSLRKLGELEDAYGLTVFTQQKYKKPFAHSSAHSRSTVGTTNKMVVLMTILAVWILGS